MGAIDRTDDSTYAPFILMDTGVYRSLILSDRHMLTKSYIFDERADEGWCGNGYDWSAIAQVVLAEQLPNLADELTFDPEAGMFSAGGSRSALEQLGHAMHTVFHNDDVIRDLLSRAELD